MKIWIAIIVLGAGLISPAIAEPKRVAVAGHTVEIRGDDVGAIEKLLVDNKELLEDHRIYLGEVASVDDVAVMVGSRNPGGNMCLGSDFILSIPKSGPARIDHPGDDCFVGETTTKVEAHRIVMEIPGSPQHAGSRWIWTPAAGLGTPTKIAFVPRTDDGWAALQARSIDHPSRIFNYADLSGQIDARVGPMRSAALRSSTGPGSLNYISGLVVARSCQSHVCDETDLLIVADVAAKTFYVALKDAKSAPVISPRPTEWPKGARSQLAAFQKRWLR